jgi:hypothetical protein
VSASIRRTYDAPATTSPRSQGKRGASACRTSSQRKSSLQACAPLRRCSSWTGANRVPGSAHARPSRIEPCRSGLRCQHRDGGDQAERDEHEPESGVGGDRGVGIDAAGGLEPEDGGEGAGDGEVGARGRARAGARLGGPAVHAFMSALPGALQLVSPKMATKQRVTCFCSCDRTTSSLAKQQICREFALWRWATGLGRGQ